ncbi:hypothetical protein, partial [Prevotella sp.]|uniref:hypothetical protein n=1 Tax=Prevotella sp. TaxID=59823 RepID=UPI00307A01C1
RFCVRTQHLLTHDSKRLTSPTASFVFRLKSLTFASMKKQDAKTKDSKPHYARKQQRHNSHRAVPLLYV